jgi:tRNA G46 methylase TrmB
MQDEFCIVRPRYGDTLDWKSVFSETKESQPEVWMEIGFGLGDNLLCLANRFPHRCFLGSEVHAGGVGAILQRLQKSRANGTPCADYTLFVEKNNNCEIHDIQTAITTTDSSGETDTAELVPTVTTSYDNLRIYRQDITKLLPYIPDHTVHSILVTFPDPFPYGPEWRLLQVDVIDELHRILVIGGGGGGGRLYLATDHPGHFQWSLSQVQAFNHGQTNKAFGLVEPTPDRGVWLPVVSKYERKGWDEGRETLSICWEAS